MISVSFFLVRMRLSPGNAHDPYVPTIHLSKNTSLRGEGCIFQALCLFIVFSAYDDHDDHSRCGDDHDAGEESGLYSCGSICRCCVT